MPAAHRGSGYRCDGHASGRVEDDFNLYAYVYNDPLNRTDPTGTTCQTDDKGKATSCHFDRVEGKLTREQQQQLKAAEKRYTQVVQKLQADPDKEVSISLPKAGSDGKPTKETNTVKTTAGAVARALISRVMVAAPNEKGAPASTSRGLLGGATTVREKGLSGKTDLYSVRGASHALVRSIMFVHEGMHDTHVDNVMRGYPSDVSDTLHQDPYNVASYDLLYR